VSRRPGAGRKHLSLGVRLIGRCAQGGGSGEVQPVARLNGNRPGKLTEPGSAPGRIRDNKNLNSHHGMSPPAHAIKIPQDPDDVNWRTRHTVTRGF
jgi:hypothetical protein